MDMDIFTNSRHFPLEVATKHIGVSCVKWYEILFLVIFSVFSLLCIPPLQVKRKSMHMQFALLIYSRRISILKPSLSKFSPDGLGDTLHFLQLLSLICRHVFVFVDNFLQHRNSILVARNKPLESTDKRLNQLLPRIDCL
jgi:hypothetical protein